MRRFLAVAITVALCLHGKSASAADYTVKAADKDFPAGVSDDIKKTLSKKAIQLLDGDKPVLDIWLDEKVPLKMKPDAPEKALNAIAETTLLGVASVDKDMRDYRDDDIPKGVYTLRLGLQPQDGNHLGTSEFPFFALLILAEQDTGVKAVKTHKELTDKSSADTSSKHPRILSLRPAKSDAKTPSLNAPISDHKTMVVKASAAAPDWNGGEITFEIVYEGKGKV